MLIAIYSPAAGSGKSAIADHLITNHGFARLSFAEPLKDMIRILLENFGYTPADAHHMTHISKQAPLPEIDPRVDSRHLLRTLGTEWGRQCVHPDIWLRCWTSRYMRLIASDYEHVVVDDMRFLNEAALIDRFSGQLWRVTRPGTACNTTHASEGGLDSLRPLDDPSSDSSLYFSQDIDNSGTLDELYAHIDGIITSHKTPIPTC
jgi:hypothetical protein